MDATAQSIWGKPFIRRVIMEPLEEQSKMGIQFDINKLQDPTYKEQFHQKLAEIKAVMNQHTFINYAINQTLLDELEQIYLNNLADYKKHFAQNNRALNKIEKKIHQSKSHLFPHHYQVLNDRIVSIQSLLIQPNFALNQEAKPALIKLEKEWKTYIAKKENTVAKLADYRQILSHAMNQVWAEDYTVHKDHYRKIRDQVLEDSGKEISIEPQQDLLEKHINDRAHSFQQAHKRLSLFPRLQKKLTPFKDNYAYRSDFAALLKKLNRRLIISWGLLIIVSSLSVAGLIVIGKYGPGWIHDYQDLQAWKLAKDTRTYQAFQDYLEAFPDGNYTDEALTGIYNLDQDSIPSMLSPDGIEFRYSGDLLFGLPHGTGKARYENGDYYEGEWIKGTPEGMGTYVEKDGSMYSGQWKSSIKTGEGTQKYVNGEVYIGKWEDNQPNGYGIMKYPDSSKYEGYWEKGKQQGRGMFQFSNGQVYRGEWEEGQFHGRGTYSFANGDQYEGSWQDGKREGQGIMVYQDGRVYTGEWKNDMKHGVGKMTWPQQVTFVGNWEKGKISGQGILTDKFRSVYEGSWKQDSTGLTFYDPTETLIKSGTLENGIFIKH